MRMGGSTSAGADRREHAFEDAAWAFGESIAGDTAQLERIEEDSADTWHVESDVGESHDEKAAHKDKAEMELGAGLAASVVELRE